MDKASEEWRQICEARHVLRMASKEIRKQYLELVEKRRGAAAKVDLEQAILAEWEKSKAKGKR